jgi:PilZ domain
VPQVPVELEQAIEKALARDPEDRYPTVRAFAEALSRVPTGDALPSSLLGIRAAAPPALPMRSVHRGAVAPAPAKVPPRPAAVLQPPALPGSSPVLPPPLPDLPSTRRRFARAPYVTPARIFRANGGTLEGRSEDISVGGLLVLAPQAFDQEERVTVRFALPITGKLLEVPATARWVKSAARGTGAVGLEFAALAPDHLKVIESYVTAMGGE